MRTEYEVKSIKENAKEYAKKHPDVIEYPVCAYLRKSEEDEKDSSLPTQLSGIEDTIKELNEQLSEFGIKLSLGENSVFKEDDVSGTTTFKRYELQRMRDAISADSYVACFVLRLDRLSRNNYDRTSIKREMMEHKCNLISVYNKDEGDEQSEMLDGIDATIALYFARISARNSVDAVKKRLKEHKVVSTLPLGLMKDPYTEGIIIDPSTAPIIKLMFNYALAGDSLEEICRK
ncbi:MAG: recombinase family protein, partial [Anaeroplasma sp.]|nr:recombinase family protein [Anaeroplasma sp.]